MFGLLTKISMGVAAAAIAAALWFYADAALTKRALEHEHELAQAWQHLSEAQERIRVREGNIDRAATRATRAIQEIPDAHTLVPPALASAWADGIDSVRASAASEHPVDVPRPDDNTPKRRGPDDRSTGAILSGSGSSISKMQRSSGRTHSSK